MEEYFNLIQQKIKDKDFTILEINKKPDGEISVFLEAINYMMWEWNDDHNDTRTHIFDYVIIPNDVDFDFTTISFTDFITFLSKEKSKEIVMIDTDNIEIITEEVKQNEKELDSFWD